MIRRLLLIHKGVLYSDALAKYAAAFFKISRSSVVLLSSALRRLISNFLKNHEGFVGFVLQSNALIIFDNIGKIQADLSEKDIYKIQRVSLVHIFTSSRNFV